MAGRLLGGSPADSALEAHTYSEEHGLRLHLLRPPQPGARAEGGAAAPGCVVWFHGGAWLHGTPSQLYRHARAVSTELGLAVASCEYRQLLTHPSARVPFDALDDAQRCIKFLQENADDLGLDRQKFILAGVSAGGHSAAMAALAEGAGPDIAGLVLFNPVLDLGFSTGWSQQRPLVWFGSRLLRARYGAAALEEKSPMHQVLAACRPTPTPQVRRVRYPTLIMHGAQDRVVPVAQSEAFQERMRSSGNVCDLVAFPEVGHRFMRASPADFSHCIGLLGTFLTSVGLRGQQ